MAMKIGPYTLHEIHAGRVGLDGGAMFGIIPKPLWERKIPADARNRIPLAMRCLLLEGDGRLVLIDNGLGDKYDAKFADIYAVDMESSNLADSLDAAGFGLDEVTDVILTHLHFDHAGGAISPVGAEWRPTFPRAETVVQRAEATAAGYTGESDRARDLVLSTLDGDGAIAWVDGDATLGDVDLTVTGGHTGAHQAVTVRSGGLAAVFGGDVLGTPGQVSRRFVAKYDVDGAASQAWRERLAREAAAEGHLLLFYHSATAPAAFVASAPDGRLLVEPVVL